VEYARDKYDIFDPLVDTDFLFYKLKHLDVGWTRMGEGTPQPVDAGIVSEIVLNLCRKGRLKKGISAHSLRKYHTTFCQAGGVPERWINIFQGKRGEGTRGVYSKPPENKLFEVYRKAYPELSIEGGASVEVQKLKDRLENQQREIDQLNTIFKNPDMVAWMNYVKASGEHESPREIIEEVTRQREQDEIIKKLREEEDSEG